MSRTVRLSSRVLPATSTILTVIVAVTCLLARMADVIAANAALTALADPVGWTLGMAL
jgi:hypothetical protein